MKSLLDAGSRLAAVLSLPVIGLAVTLGAPGDAAAVPIDSEQVMICGLSPEVVVEGGGCCVDEDQDGYIDTCWTCDADGENCVSEELGEDLRAPLPGRGGQTGGAPSGPSTSIPGRTLPQQLQRLID